MTLSLDAALRDFQPQLPLGVGLSAGADSTALLAVCAAKWPGQVVALHVNHNLQKASVVFEQRCAELCNSLGVVLRTASVDAKAQAGQSPEDAARIARYRALTALAGQPEGVGPLKSIALAHHADDQVETLLIALARGAGLAGMAAMPAHWMRDGFSWYRPLLRVSRAEVRDWLQRAQISFVEDPSNADPSFTRNRIRAGLIPSLEAVFPSFRDTFVRSSGHCAAAQDLLNDLARMELEVVLRPTDGLPQIQALQKLNANHRGNVLRYWLKNSFGVIPSTAQLDELVRQIAVCVNRGKAIHIKVGAGFAVRQGAVLNWYNPELSQRKY